MRLKTTSNRTPFTSSRREDNACHVLRHTEGPWTIEERDDGSTAIVNTEKDHPQGPFAVATVNMSRGHESIANARLLVQGPDIADLLRRFTDWYDAWAPSRPDTELARLYETACRILA